MEKVLISITVFCLGISVIYSIECYNYPKSVQELVPVQVIKQNVKQFEAKVRTNRIKQVMFDYRGPEPDSKELMDFLNEHPKVTSVIRLNGESKDSNGLSIREEAEICNSKGVTFYYKPMLKDYKLWAESIIPIMLKENVFVHCHYGYDRTGFIFGYKLIKYHKYSFNDIWIMNGWNKYDKYSKKFYPILEHL